MSRADGRRARGFALAISAALALGACTSSSGGNHGSSAPASGSTPPSSAQATGHAIRASELAARITAAVDKLTSAKFTVSFSGVGESLSGYGAEKLSHGKLVALQVTQSSAQSASGAQLTVVGDKTYARLPAGLTKSRKPYVLVRSDSKNTLVKQLATRVSPALYTVTLGNVGPLVLAAKSVTDNGSQTVSGAPTTSYSVVVDVAKLPNSLSLKKQLTDNQVQTVPLQLNLDSAGRPVVISENFSMAGSQISLRATLSDFDSPLTISAPPASQVSTE